MREEIFIKQRDLLTGKNTYYDMSDAKSVACINEFIDWCIMLDKQFERVNIPDNMKYSIVSHHGVPKECVKCGCESYEQRSLCMPCDMEEVANVQIQ
ncbi:hypothetical protein PDK27_06170 [Bacillus cereus group sp. TH230-1LC]|nr:hypothetical protein [Bacillus cereus group sp. TH230-1LC]